jgi:MerR family copper efflux transcriptional regulator
MLISELAAKTEITIDTIRFYEKQGLLDRQHFTRGSNGYRYYNEGAIQRLMLIQHAQAAGITLGEMQQSLGEWEQGTINREELLDFFQSKLEQIDRRIIALQQMKAYLQQKMESVKAELNLNKIR